MKDIITGIKYHKLILLIITFGLAYSLFQNWETLPFHNFVLSLGYFGTFLAGILFAYGFTAAPATALLLILAQEQNFWIAGLLGGVGALVGDYLIFRFIRHSLDDELRKLAREKPVRYVNRKIPALIKIHLIPVIAGFIIASPLPDEIGVSLLAVSRHISTKVFLVISYVLNTLGILVILAMGQRF